MCQLFASFSKMSLVWRQMNIEKVWLSSIESHLIYFWEGTENYSQYFEMGSQFKMVESQIEMCQ